METFRHVASVADSLIAMYLYFVAKDSAAAAYWMGWAVLMEV
jgi:hypothetical protein